MARIPFAVHSYALDSLPASAQDLINLYAEEALTGARSPVVIKNVPGLVDYVAAGASQLWALVPFDDDIYAIVGGFPQFSVYKVEYSGSMASQIGTATLIGTTTGGVGTPVTAAASETQMVFVTPPLAWVVSGGVLQQITDPDFPAVTSVAYLGGFFVFSKQGGDQYIISNILDATNYDSLDIQSAEFVPDAVRRVFAHNNELWVFCDRSIEIHRNTGAADFPFEPQSGGVIDVGTLSLLSVAAVDDTVCWLGSDLVVYQANGYRQRRISTHAIEAEIATFRDPTAVNCFALNFLGHKFYVMTFSDVSSGGANPDGKTFVYDTTTQLWHRRASTFANGLPDKWNVTCAIEYGPYTLCGGATGGQIWRMTDTTTLEDGASLTAVATLPPQWADAGLAFADRLELEMEPGGNASDLNVTLTWSDDGGYTFSAGIARSMGASGARSKRIFWSRLGKFRQRVFKFTFAAGARVRAYGADLRQRATQG